MIDDRADIGAGARPIHEGRATAIDIMMMQLDRLWRNAEIEEQQEGGKAVLAAAERHDEPPVSGEVGTEAARGHAAARIWSPEVSEATRPVARSRYPAAASAFAAAVMMARESLRSTRNHDPI